MRPWRCKERNYALKTEPRIFRMLVPAPVISQAFCWRRKIPNPKIWILLSTVSLMAGEGDQKATLPRINSQNCRLIPKRNWYRRRPRWRIARLSFASDDIPMSDSRKCRRHSSSCAPSGCSSHNDPILIADPHKEGSTKGQRIHETEH
jgi:hypothetical protein